MHIISHHHSCMGCGCAFTRHITIHACWIAVASTRHQPPAQPVPRPPATNPPTNPARGPVRPPATIPPTPPARPVRPPATRASTRASIRHHPCPPYVTRGSYLFELHDFRLFHEFHGPDGPVRLVFPEFDAPEGADAERPHHLEVVELKSYTGGRLKVDNNKTKNSIIHSVCVCCVCVPRPTKIPEADGRTYSRWRPSRGGHKNPLQRRTEKNVTTSGLVPR